MTWKTIPSAPGYEASNEGHIRNKVRPDHALKPWTHRKGHQIISVAGKKRKVHHLIMEAFDKPRPPVLMCRHIDGNPKNNHIDNLEWGTNSENVIDYIMQNGSHMRGDATPWEIAQKIRDEHDGRRGTGKRLAEKYGISQSAVTSIHTGRSFKYLKKTTNPENQ